MSGDWLYALYRSEAEAIAALRHLAGDGVPPADVEVRSSFPLEHGAVPDVYGARSRLPRMALVGAVLGGTLAFLLVSLTSRAISLPTGGMPIVAGPTTAVIVFEGVALGAILVTVATVLVEGGLPAIRAVPEPFSDQVAAGGVVVAVRAAEGRPSTWAAEAVATEILARRA